MQCIDKPNCLVKNGWFSLEPQCPGNSYYTQVEYDCQPSFYMCDKNSVINNVFSGLVYSPNYPNSFRTESDKPCYLTIHMPKNHHIEITLDYFNILKTKKCIGDYLEIQEYIETNINDLKVKENILRKNKRDFGYLFAHNETQNELNDNSKISETINEMKNHSLKVNIYLGLSNNKQRRSKYKWNTLGSMCGKVETKFTIRAKSDIINIKFRPLNFDHQYLTNLNQDQSQNMGFKIYFQGKKSQNQFPFKNQILSYLSKIKFDFMINEY
jgi:hypothetical protein